MQPDDVPLPPPLVEAEAVRDAVEGVLARPEYAALEPGLLERVWDVLARAFGQLLDALTGTVAGSVLGYVVLALLAAGLVLLAVRVGRSMRREAEASVATQADVGRAPADWLGDAEAHEAAGRWREGVRCRYRALVAALAAAGVVDEVPGRTAGEYLAAVRDAAPDAVDDFAAATGTFERAWYGRGDVGPADAEAFRAAASSAAEAAGIEAPPRIGAGA